MPRVEREASPSPPPGYRKRQAEDSSVGLALRRLHDRSATIAAATRIKNRRWQHGLVKMWMVAMRKVLVAMKVLLTMVVLLTMKGLLMMEILLTMKV